jgi:hypothetical protein
MSNQATYHKGISDLPHASIYYMNNRLFEEINLNFK